MRENFDQGKEQFDKSIDTGGKENIEEEEERVKSIIRDWHNQVKEKWNPYISATEKMNIESNVQEKDLENFSYYSVPPKIYSEYSFSNKEIPEDILENFKSYIKEQREPKKVEAKIDVQGNNLNFGKEEFKMLFFGQSFNQVGNLLYFLEKKQLSKKFVEINFGDYSNKESKKFFDDCLTELSKQFPDIIKDHKRHNEIADNIFSNQANAFGKIEKKDISEDDKLKEKIKWLQKARPFEMEASAIRMKYGMEKARNYSGENNPITRTMFELYSRDKLRDYYIDNLFNKLRLERIQTSDSKEILLLMQKIINPTLPIKDKNYNLDNSMLLKYDIMVPNASLKFINSDFNIYEEVNKKLEYDEDAKQIYDIFQERLHFYFRMTMMNEEELVKFIDSENKKGFNSEEYKTVFSTTIRELNSLLYSSRYNMYSLTSKDPLLNNCYFEFMSKEFEKYFEDMEKINNAHQNQ